VKLEAACLVSNQLHGVTFHKTGLPLWSWRLRVWFPINCSASRFTRQGCHCEAGGCVSDFQSTTRRHVSQDRAATVKLEAACLISNQLHGVTFHKTGLPLWSWRLRVWFPTNYTASRFTRQGCHCEAEGCVSVFQPTTRRHVSQDRAATVKLEAACLFSNQLHGVTFHKTALPSVAFLQSQCVFKLQTLQASYNRMVNI
jgi:hypothetical protein